MDRYYFGRFERITRHKSPFGSLATNKGKYSDVLGPTHIFPIVAICFYNRCENNRKTFPFEPSLDLTSYIDRLRSSWSNKEC